MKANWHEDKIVATGAAKAAQQWQCTACGKTCHTLTRLSEDRPTECKGYATTASER